MKALLFPLSVLAAAGLLFGSATPARACSCVNFADPAMFDSYMDTFDAIVIGRAAPPPDAADFPQNIYIAVVERVTGPEQQLLPSAQPLVSGFGNEGPGPMCDYSLDQQSSRLHVLALMASPEGPYMVAGCGSFPVDELNPYMQDFYSRIEAIAESLSPSEPGEPVGGTAEEEPPSTGQPESQNQGPVEGEPAQTAQPASGSRNLPFLPLVAAAALGPAAFLLAASFLLARRSR